MSDPITLKHRGHMQWDYFRQARMLQNECFRDFGITIEIRAVLSYSSDAEDQESCQPDSIYWGVAIQSFSDPSPSNWITSFIDKWEGIRTNNPSCRVMGESPHEAYRSFKLAMFRSLIDDGLIQSIPMHSAMESVGRSVTNAETESGPPN